MYLFRNFVLKTFRVTKLVVYLGAASEHSLELPQQTLQYFALLCIVETFPNLDIKFSKTNFLIFKSGCIY